MKVKSLLLPALLLTSLLSFAQIEKGSTLIGGTLAFSTVNNESNNSKLTAFNISPAIGKALKQNLVLGVDLLYYYSKSKSVGVPANEAKTNGIGGGVFLRQYASLAKKLYLFGQGRIGTAFYKTEHTSPAINDYKNFNINLSAYPGFAYSITPRLMLEAGLPNLLQVNYGSQKIENSSDKNSSFEILTSLSDGVPLSIGLRVLLR